MPRIRVSSRKIGISKNPKPKKAFVQRRQLRPSELVQRFNESTEATKNRLLPQITALTRKGYVVDFSAGKVKLVKLKRRGDQMPARHAIVKMPERKEPAKYRAVHHLEPKTLRERLGRLGVTEHELKNHPWLLELPTDLPTAELEKEIQKIRKNALM